MIIPNTARQRVSVDENRSFMVPVELPELVVIDQEKKQLVFRMNQSRLQTYMGCSRAFMWKYVEDLDVGKPYIRMELGSGAHEGLAQLASGASMDEAMKAAVARFKMEFKDEQMLPGEMEEITAAEETLRKLLPAYVDHWGDQPFTPLGIEIGGQVTVGTVLIDGVSWECIIVFRLDKLVTFNQQIWIVDHKTAAKLDLRDVSKYAMDLQFTAYTYAATKLLQQQLPEGSPFEPRVQGVIVDMLVKTKVPQFHRDIFPRTDAELTEFQYDWLGWCEVILRQAVRGEQFISEGLPRRYAYPKNTKWCFYFGTCPYYNLCLKDTQAGRDLFVHRKMDYVETPEAKSV